MFVKYIEETVMERVEKENWEIDPHKDLGKLIEEVGELSKEIYRIEDGSLISVHDKESVRKEIASEIGDILFPLVKILRNYQLALHECYMNCPNETTESLKWSRDSFKIIGKLMESVGELSREVRRYEEGRQRPDETEPDKISIRREIATKVSNVMFHLVKIAEKYKLTLEDCYQIHLEKMNKRYDSN